jgi:hypothetical protein
MEIAAWRKVILYCATDESINIRDYLNVGWLGIYGGFKSFASSILLIYYRFYCIAVL